MQLNEYELKDFHLRLTAFLQDEEIFCRLDSHQYYKPGDKYHSFDALIGIGAQEIIPLPSGNVFESLSNHLEAGKWLMGFLGYELKNEIESLSSNHESSVALPEAFFFVPKNIIFLNGNNITIEGEDSQRLWQKIENTKPLAAAKPLAIELLPRMCREEYIEKIGAIKRHIMEGDIYELNFCQEFYAQNRQINPFYLWQHIGEDFPQPFSAFMRIQSQYILCASMERFLRKEGNKVISQPIKGTVKRGQNEREDRALAEALRFNEKERAENIMIVDLVRNDLARSCRTGTVKVEELCGLYPFPGLWQMISTVIGELKEHYNAINAIRNAFPMGSMTGAPKVRAMQLIEDYETSSRGIYSGAIGYFAPDGNFDFNVVIRTLLYNAGISYLSLHVGSAITFDATAAQEYDECLLKIEKWKSLLSGLS